MRIKHLPLRIARYNGNKEEVLELEHIYKVFRYDMELGNLLANIYKASKKAKFDLGVDVDSIPF